MTGILKDFNFAIAYLDDIIIFRRTAEEHLSHIKQVFEKLHSVKALNEVQQMPFLYKGNTILRTHPQHQGHLTITFKNTSHPEHASTQNAQTSSCLSWISRILQKMYKNFTKIAKPLTLLTHQQVKFDWTPTHHAAFMKLKESIIQTPILSYPYPNKRYIVYTDASDDV